MLTTKQLTGQHAQFGRLQWIGIRPVRRAPIVWQQSVAITRCGLEGDHRSAPGSRAVTLIQHEHLPVIAALAGIEEVTPQMLRRNLVVSGISLLALKDREFTIGNARLRGTGICAPCSRMEHALGHGGYNAVRGHGGITAEVIEPGRVELGDTVRLA